MKTYSFLLVFASMFTLAWAQRSQVFLPELQTLRIEKNGQDNALAIIRLNSDEYLNISFDDLTHEYKRYTYHIEHLDIHFKPSTEIFEANYAYSAQPAIPIENFAESRNTQTNYTHYALTIPNKDIRPLLSGNYRLIIHCEDEAGDKQTAAIVYFFVVEEKVPISINVTTNTDIDYKNSHQQLVISTDGAALNLRDPQTELFTIALQNNRWDNAVINPSPTSIMGNKIEWRHARSLIFEAGNEYNAIEMLKSHSPGMNMESVRWFDPLYHATVQTNVPAKNYRDIDDRNGQSVIRNDEGYDDTTESEYLLTHFSLASDQIPDAKVYINGAWTHNLFHPKYELKYNTQTNCYEISLLLKTGYYSYQYLTHYPNQKDTSHTAAFEGDYWQTENNYAFLVYYKKNGGRYWQLVGAKQSTFKP